MQVKYRQIDANNALELCKAGTTVLAARYVDGMTFREVSAAAVLLAVELPKSAEVAPEPVTPEPCATSHTQDKPARGRKPKLNITAREVAELKEKSMTCAEMADHFDVNPKQMSAWMYTHKADVEEATQQLQGARALATKVFEDKEDTDGEHQN